MALLSHCVCAWRKRKDNPCLNLHLARGIQASPSSWRMPRPSACLTRRKSFQDLKEPSSRFPGCQPVQRNQAASPFKISKNLPAWRLPSWSGSRTGPQVLSRSQRTFHASWMVTSHTRPVPQVFSRSQRTFQPCTSRPCRPMPHSRKSFQDLKEPSRDSPA